jgi:hypothetical protein
MVERRTVVQAALLIAVSVMIAVSLFGFVGDEWGDAGQLLFIAALGSTIVVQAVYRRVRQGWRDPDRFAEVRADVQDDAPARSGPAEPVS